MHHFTKGIQKRIHVGKMVHFVFCIDAYFRKNYNKIIRDNEFVYPYRLLKYMLRR